MQAKNMSSTPIPRNFSTKKGRAPVLRAIPCPLRVLYYVTFSCPCKRMTIYEISQALF